MLTPNHRAPLISGVAFFLLSWLSPPSLLSGEYNRVLNIGDEAPQWKDLASTLGETHSLQHLESATAIVVVFTCNRCPYAVDVENRLMALHGDYHQKGVAIVAINSSKTPEDSLEAMKEKAFEFAYLLDKTQQIAKDYGAKYTPEFFVIDRDRKIIYMGSLDDSPDGKHVKRQYVREALRRCLATGDEQVELSDVPQESVVQETVPIGCRIRIERQRRKKRSE